MRTKNVLRVGALALGVTLIATGCSGSPAEPNVAAPAADGWAEIATAAAKEGSVVVYGNKDAAAFEAFGAAFEAAYPGVDFEYIKAGSSGEISIKIDQEETAGADGADVVITTDEPWLTSKLATKSIIVPEGPTVTTPEWTDVLLGGAALPISVEPFLIGWNTKLVKKAPKSHEDVLDNPQFGEPGTVGMVDNVSSSIVVIYSTLEAGLKKAGYDGDYLDEFAKLKPRLYPGSTPMAQSLASGEILVSIEQSPAAIEAVKATGAPVDYIVPEDYAVGITFYAAQLVNSKRPNASQALLDFMGTKKGQELLNGKIGESPVASDKKVSSMSFEGLTEAKTKAFASRFNALFK